MNAARKQANAGQPLSALLDGIAEVDTDVAVAGVATDSREVVEGGLFMAAVGHSSHGLNWLADALERKPAAVAWQPGPGWAEPELPAGVVGVMVPSLARRVGVVADRFFDAPSADVAITAITGTNGKTTTAHIVAQGGALVGEPTGEMGTLGFGTPQDMHSTALTTPDAVTVHRNIASLRDAGIRRLAMEVSSHGLDQGRVTGVRFDTAVFTNLSRDHLDYHGDFATYANVKAQLFAWPGLRLAVINAADSAGRRILETLPPGPEPIALLDSASPRTVDCRYLRATEVVSAPTGVEVHFDSSWGSGVIRSRLFGTFNASNLLAAAAVLLGWDKPLDEVITALEAVAAPAGRMEAFGGGGQPLLLVDFAHTPDALSAALSAVREHCKGQLWCVFGCGGDRDRGKRSEMGAVAATLADRIVLTDDNPRTEDGDRIVSDILAGASDAASQVLVERDRRAAIELAFSSVSAGDTILVAGKGHEDYQETATGRRPFSDSDEARRLVGGDA